jgi:formylglycine-generating enzyme required for sulfatase activity
MLHPVKLSAFKMSKYEITFEQYDIFCESTKRLKPDDEGWGRGNMPVINVSWNDAVAFAEWMDCRLPTEAEWEYACRAGSSTSFNFGNILTPDRANFNGNYPHSYYLENTNRKKPLPVGSFLPNLWGLYDMHGNLWEWCSDWYGKDYLSTQVNPKGANKGSMRVIRGGSWLSFAMSCRSASRLGCEPELLKNMVGLRLVSNL